AGGIPPVCFFPGGKTFACVSESSIRLFDSGTGQPLPPTRNSSAPIAHVSFADQGKTVTAVGQNDVGRWDVAARKLTVWSPLGINEGPILSRFAISDDGRLCLERATKGAVVREIATNRVVCSLPVEEVNIRFATFTADGRVVGVGLAGGGFY